MLNFVAHRLPQACLTLVLASIVTFLLVRIVPGDVVDVIAVEGSLTDSAKAELRAEQGLNQPVAVQYVQWISRTVRGDFGHSYWTHLPVRSLFAQAFPKTAELAMTSLAIALLVGLPLGTLAGAYRNSVFDYIATLLATLMISMPTFAIAIVALLIFAVQLQWLPATGSMVLPALVLGIDVAGTLVRTLRTDVRSELRSDYVRTATAKGLPSLTVLRRHILPNSLTATLTVIGLAFGHLLGGTVIVESIFHWPGIGSLMIEAIRNRDYPIVEAVVVVMTAAFVIANLGVDILHSYFDPRVRV